MQTRPTLRAMLSELEALEAKEAERRGASCVPFIRYPSCMDKAAVIERYFALFPDERDAELVVVTCIEGVTAGDELNCGYDRRADKAWRQIAQEQAA
jgi:hypothetical protein